MFSVDMLGPFMHVEDEFVMEYDVNGRVWGQSGAQISSLGLRELRKLVEDRVEHECFNANVLSFEERSVFQATLSYDLHVTDSGDVLAIQNQSDAFDELGESKSREYQACVTDALHSLSGDKRLDHRLLGRSFGLDIIHEYRRTPWISNALHRVVNSMTVTRLHGQFTPEQAGEDIIFTLAAPIQGGFGTPDIETDAMSQFYTISEDYKRSRFQARYITIDSKAKADIKQCKKKKREWFSYWASPSRETVDAARVKVGKKPDLSKEKLEKLVKNAAEAKLDL